MFQAVESSVSFPKLEEAVARFWKERGIYEKSLAARRDAAPFVFYEGPPTANGLPHPGHCLTRAIKDLFPRYKTMRGLRCQRKAGWDTHGLPVEVEVCKELGIHSKEEIEAFGVEPFIQKCLESVFRYTKQWEHLTERLGFWIHLDDAYVTYHQSYVESVWWALKTLFDRGLLYQGYKIVWWWAQGGTALSSGEVGQGYREVADPAVFVRFPLVAEGGEGRGAGNGGKPLAASQKKSPLLVGEGQGEGQQQSPLLVGEGQGSGRIVVEEWDEPPLLVGEGQGEGQQQSPLPVGEGQGEGLLRNADLLVWTTTPWTLPSNQFAAVKPDLDYAVVSVEGEPRKLILAAALVENVMTKVGKEFSVLATIPGEKLIGLRYVPPFDCYYKDIDSDRNCTMLDTTGMDESEKAEYRRKRLEWRVVVADFVTTDTGTGIVHIAPAFGEDDFRLLQQLQQQIDVGYMPVLLNPVTANGMFTAEVPQYKGRWVKDCDRDIIRDLKARGLLFHQEQYKHDYPFCWRAEEDPLIQYPRKSWFIRTTALKDKMLANNRLINWLPEHIRDGRFGNFLETNVDWALSRERYWGTPLPIWVCEKTGRAEAVGSYAELLSKPGVSGTEVWEEAKRKNPALADDLKIHKPYIDAITYDSPFAAGARMRRVSEVIDCWFDSGAMPFAQWGYPHLPDSAVRLADQFPADFISEALDQTRGWFYSLLAISTLLFGEGSGDGGRGAGDGGKSNLPSSASGRGVGGEGSPPGSQSALTLALSQGERGQNLKSPNLQISKSPNPLIPNPQSLIPRPFPHPFRTCIVLGLMLGEDGGKMSKSKRNYRDPEEIFSLYGADALRWYFFANQPPWTSIRYSEQAIKDCIPEFLLRLWNVYSFFVIYANIDGFDPADALCGAGVPPAQLDSDVLARAKGYRPIAQRGELDRWILGELNSTAAAVVERMDAYDNFAACGRLTDFVDALSNWYVRRSRDRFWSGEKLAESADKLDAYWTLYECLLTTCKLIAPFVPFLAEAMWQNLAVAAFSNTKDHKKPLESVHLCDYPSGDATAVDPQLSAQMSLMREITSLGRSARMAAKLKVRQPLAQVEVVLADETHRGWLEQHAALIREELNVKRVEFITEAKKYVTYLIQPDLKRLGPRLGKRLPAVRKLLTEADGARLCEQLKSRGSISLRLEDGPIELSGEDVQIRLQARAGWAAAEGRAVVVVLSTELTEELILEGLARELVRAIQDRRKELDCQFTDRIAVGIETDAAELRAAVEHFGDYISGETLAVELKLGPLPGVEPVELDIAGHKARLNVKPM